MPTEAVGGELREGELVFVDLEGGEPGFGVAADGVEGGVVGVGEWLDEAGLEADLEEGGFPMGEHWDGGDGGEHGAKVGRTEGEKVVEGVGAVGGGEVVVDDPGLDAGCFV